MLDVDTFLTALYVIVDDFCQSRPPQRRTGPARRKGDPARRHPSLTARCSPLPSSLGGPGSQANGTSTATPAATLERPSRPCPIALSQIGWCASTPRSF